LGADILGQLGNPQRAYPDESLAILCRMLESEKDEEVLCAAAVGLGHLNDTRAAAPLARLQDHPSAEVRSSIVHALLTQEEAPAISALIALSADENDHVRDWATFGLGSQIDTDTPEIRETLIRRIADPHDDTRAEALMGLARRRDKRVVEPLRQELSSECVGTLVVEAAREIGDARLYSALVALQEWWDLDEALLEEAIARCAGEPAPATSDAL
jgi:HEAT repeat protein